MSVISVSIIIPVYNGALLIERCLKSVTKQLGNFKLEIILIDDGSTDESISIAKVNFPDIIVIQQKNQGPAAARNKGIEMATGKYLAFLDADDYWEPDFLKETVIFLEKHDAVAVSVGQLHRIIGKEDTIMPLHIADNKYSTYEAWILEDFYDFWALHNHVCTGSVLMLTEIVKQSGGQRPELRITEDLEFWAYLATFGKWGFIPKVLFVSDGGEVTKEQGWIEKNRKRWESAPNMALWEQRIIKNIPNEHLASFNKAKQPILKNLTLSMLYSNRIKEARKMIRENINVMANDKISVLLKVCSISVVSWHLLAYFLLNREKNRKI
ncbi:glycosyltransferase [Owenweeksia hongkongensis]|uniref:glycosyltransferase n=1 Tax=Owenweeksia hongkongensis TaxID=253245 RepID=UPI003A8CB82C